MPLYEYECRQCHRRTEKIQKFSDPELTVCPHCGGPLERTITAPAVQFKGGGWYNDLYSSAKPAAAPAGETKAGEAAPAKVDGAAPAAPSAPSSSPAQSPSTPSSSGSGS